MAYAALDQLCALCNDLLGDGETVTLRQKGVHGIQKAAADRNETVNVEPGQKVHIECRRRYTNPNIISIKRKITGEPPVKADLRSGKVFSFKDDCLFCGRSINETNRQKIYKEYFLVRTKDFQNEIHEKAKERCDEWANEVLARIEFSCDLHASDTVYHQVCSVNFRKGRSKPVEPEFSSTKKRRTSGGRTRNSIREEAFLKVTKFLEDNDDEQITIQTLVNKMSEFIEGGDGFTIKYMKTRLLEYFGDEIVITTVQKTENVVTFKRKASKILHDFHNQPNYDDPEQEKLKIIRAASKLIKSDIRSLKENHEVYPSPEDVICPEKGIEYLPESLKCLLSEVFVGTGKSTDIKRAAIGQAIIQATRPRVLIAPLQLGLSVQLHHHFGSKYLIDTLSKLGFCCSYKEVQRFEQSAAVGNNSEIPGHTQGQFIQYIADNVDHNIDTLDGRGTFHGMGIVAAVTPSTKTNKKIQRLKVTQSELKELGKIKISIYLSKQYPELRYETLPELDDHDQTRNIGILWKTTWLLKDDSSSWSGTMQMVSKGEYPGQSSVIFMPMIDLNPSDESCIHSTLLWVSDHAGRYSVTPVITFDQPLFYKANQIVMAEQSDSKIRNIVIRLGAFHAEMSFLGSIGYIMNDTGLQEILAEVYAEKAVAHMLTGKAVSRAFRGHGLVYIALQSLVVSDVFNIKLQKKICKGEATENLSQEETNESDSMQDIKKTAETQTHDQNNNAESYSDEVIDNDLQNALQLFEDVLAEKISMDTACHDDVIQQIDRRINAYLDEARQSKTGQLWVQYMEMIEMLQTLIKAERTGNWHLHLQTFRNMLPFFAAAGHNLYAKSVYLYLINMYKLPQTHPELYKHFLNGLHVVRRSDRYWAGLSTDLVIEQTLMRSLKSVGGLTRGRGMTELQRAIWVLSRPATSEMNEAMQNFCGTLYTTSEQHKDTETAMRKRDRKDAESTIEYLEERNPFKTGPYLRSIISGVISDGSNAHKAREIGEKVISKMAGKTVKEFTFKKKDIIIQMNDKAGIKIDGETVKIDPQLLFQRLVSAAKTSDETELPSVLAYELCTHPPALFENPRMMRAADKPALAKAMKTKDNPCVNSTTVDTHYVIDGGMLLQLIPWESGDTYGELCEPYITYVNHNFMRATVVFDGYGGQPTTKDNTHDRRNACIVGTQVIFDEKTRFHGKKKVFLANSENKQTFINLLSRAMNNAGIETVHAIADADVLIVLTAVKYASTIRTVLIGDDTDLLVLLCYHASVESMPLFFQPRPRSHQEPLSWNIHQLKQQLGDEVCRNILFIHAILGCDTTSKLHGVGKAVGLKMFNKSEQFRNAASTFDLSPENTSMESVVKAGEQALVCVYKGTPGQDMNTLRVSTFVEKVSKSSMCVDPKQLPPTSNAVKFHSQRVYLQIQEWKGENNLDPLEWGWENMNTKLYPKTTDKAPAPAQIMNVVRCTCQTGCRTLACSCRKVGFECSPACSYCKGLCCENALKPDLGTD